MVARVQMMPDNQLRERVMREVEWDPEITSTDIAVTVDEAVAALGQCAREELPGQESAVGEERIRNSGRGHLGQAAKEQGEQDHG